jgi:predicted nucleotidyltransferase
MLPSTSSIRAIGGIVALVAWRSTTTLGSATGISRRPSAPRSNATLVGSRATGTPVPLSDWDFVVRADDLHAVATDLPTLAADLEPLAAQWDRLGPPEYSCYMLMLPGPAKVDLIVHVPHELEPRWEVTGATLDGIDRHFWDWTLWLASKRQRGETALVAEQLELMSEHLLRPLGVAEVPGSIEEAVAAYRGARDRREAQFGVAVSRRLEREVLRVLPA